jgi:hypothetical protein
LFFKSFFNKSHIVMAFITSLKTFDMNFKNALSAILGQMSNPWTIAEHNMQSREEKGL